MNFAQLLNWNNSINNNHYVPRAFLKNCTFDVFKSEKPSLGRLDIYTGIAFRAATKSFSSNLLRLDNVINKKYINKIILINNI